jgi:hypothetical protein
MRSNILPQFKKKSDVSLFNDMESPLNNKKSRPTATRSPRILFGWNKILR